MRDDSGGCVGCLLLFVALILCCSGIYSCDQALQQNHLNKFIAEQKVFVDDNGCQVKVLHTYPRHNHRGHFMGHTVVVEGVKTKARIEMPAHPALPVPGEIWQITLDEKGHYQFSKKAE